MRTDLRADRVQPDLRLDLRDRSCVGLAEVVSTAAQLTRVDRKYLVARDLADRFLTELPASFRILTVDERRLTSYSSIYFDTVRLDACRDHVQRRRRRWKARSRLYVEDQLCRFEVKTRDGRGLTVKEISPSEPGRHGVLGPDERGFVAGVLGAQGVDVDAESLHPSMQVDYRRLTLADTEQSLRVTLDWGVECARGSQRVWVDPGWVVVETKGDLRPSVADRVLGSLGVRPRSFSKYVSAASMLHDDISDNDIRRLRGRQLHMEQVIA